MKLSSSQKFICSFVRRIDSCIGGFCFLCHSAELSILTVDRCSHIDRHVFKISNVTANNFQILFHFSFTIIVRHFLNVGSRSISSIMRHCQFRFSRDWRRWTITAQTLITIAQRSMFTSSIPWKNAETTAFIQLVQVFLCYSHSMMNIVQTFLKVSIQRSIDSSFSI